MKTSATPLMTAIALALLTACGGKSYVESTAEQGGGSNQEGFFPSLSFSFELSGPSGTTPDYTTEEIFTDSILKVRIQSGPAGALTAPGYENWSMSYGCVSYKVTLYNVTPDGSGGTTLVQNGQSYQTSILAVDGGDTTRCPDAKQSQVIDFSNRLGGPYPHAIKISDAKYSFYCELWWYAYNMNLNPTYIAGYYNQVCPQRLVHSTHTVSGGFDVQVNGSNSVQ